MRKTETYVFIVFYSLVALLFWLIFVRCMYLYIARALTPRHNTSVTETLTEQEEEQVVMHVSQ